MTHSTEKAEALAFLTAHKVGVLSTISREHQPRGRMIYYANDDVFGIYFVTLSTTRKADDIDAYPVAAFTISDETTFQTLQLEGTIENITNTPTKNEIIESLFDHLQVEAGHYPPLAHLDRGDVQFYKFTPAWIRWGDFEGGFRTKDVLFELDA